MINNNLLKFIEFVNKKKKKFIESIDLNIKIINKKKNFFTSYFNLLYSSNDFLKILILNENNIFQNKNVFYGIKYLNLFINNKLNFDKILFNEKYFNYLKNKNIKRFLLKKNIIKENYCVEKILDRNVKIFINKENFINIKLANTNFSNKILIDNYNFCIKNLKNIFFVNKIFIEKIYISSTMSKSFIIK